MQRRAGLLFIALLIVTSATPGHAQGLGQLFGNLLSNSAQSAGMKKFCEQSQVAVYFAGTTFGYYISTGGGDKVAIDKANALAEELVSRARIADWTFQSWTGNQSNGSCRMRYHIDLAAQDAVHFANDPVIEGQVYVNVVNQDGQWRVTSFSDQPGSGPNSALNYARPFTEKIIADRSNAERLAREEQQRLAQAERQRAEQDYWAAHPKEYQAYLARQRAQRMQEQAAAEAKAADEARRARACENAGGTWGRRTNRYGVPIGEVGCFFQTVGE